MNKNEMIKMLSESSEKYIQELKELEVTFNAKREEFIKIQGALEALKNLEE